MRVLPSATLSQTLELEHFASAYRSSKRVVDLARQAGPERDKLNHCQSAMLTISSSSKNLPLVYHSNRQALSAAQFRRTGLLSTADICKYHNIIQIL